MPIDIYAPTSNDTLTRIEYELYTLINNYRVENGLLRIALSTDLTLTAGRHAEDVSQNIWGANLELPEGTSGLHSWSDNFFYNVGHPNFSGDPMWEAPARLGTGYGTGFEISAAGYTSVQAAFEGFIGSAPHNDTILNSGIWDVLDWNAMGVGIVQDGPAGNTNLGGNIYHIWFGSDIDPFAPLLENNSADGLLTGTEFSDRIRGDAGDDIILGGDGADTIIGGNGNDSLTGGSSQADLRDFIVGGAGADTIDGGYGNDELHGGAGDDMIAGGFGVDSVVGGEGNDTLTGSAWSDLIFGGQGGDFINGGFGFDRLNGGDGADRFFHLGHVDHGSDWIQDYSSAEGDVLLFGGPARGSDFQVNFATTENAGSAGIAEAFVIYRPTDQIMWALVDGAGQAEINVQINGQIFDLTA